MFDMLSCLACLHTAKVVNLYENKNKFRGWIMEPFEITVFLCDSFKFLSREEALRNTSTCHDARKAYILRRVHAISTLF